MNTQCADVGIDNAYAPFSSCAPEDGPSGIEWILGANAFAFRPIQAALVDTLGPARVNSTYGGNLAMAYGPDYLPRLPMSMTTVPGAQMSPQLGLSYSGFTPYGIQGPNYGMQMMNSGYGLSPATGFGAPRFGARW